MSNGFGQYESAPQGPDMDDGEYSALVRSAILVTDDKGVPTESYGKKQVNVRFMIDRETELRRRFSISYGQNKTTGEWAAWAQFLQAATGIKCGSPEQKEVGPAELENIEVRIVVKRNDRGFMDITDVLAPKRKPTPTTRGDDLAARARANAVVAKARQVEDTDDLTEEDIGDLYSDTDEILR